MIIRKGIKYLYAINLIEGEGLGTAYEYYVKFRKLNKFINSIGVPKRILIAGLPEKYGLSFDFFLLGQMLKAEVVVFDERIDVLERAQKILQYLRSKKHFYSIFDNMDVTFLKIDQLAEFKSLIRGKFDLALSSEVFQRLYGCEETYICNLKRLANNFAIFVPNRRNKSHARLSGLDSVYLEDLFKYFTENPKNHVGTGIYDYGYVDMPPFPPGLSRSQEKRDHAAESWLESFFMKGLEIYSLAEDFIPRPIKEKLSHIVYIMVKNHPSSL